jgi:hypothetical protein
METTDNINVPRDPNIGNNRVTKDIESYLLDLFSDHPEDPHSYKELNSRVKRKFSSTYGDDLLPHTKWAIDTLHFNKLIKRVAPGVFESIDGPDEVYTERETGHAPEGPMATRGYNVTSKETSRFKSKSDFNLELDKALLSVRMLKNMGKTRTEVESMLLSGNFNPVTSKLALKKIFDAGEV